ncbi:sensor histidine kinase [Chryseobacterium indoltheticum]|jgi:signal transduction histidine kinase|uniref:histidine kinase n=1 Tax=Chryseobacterium indoltheticum TaxID=254 RepID=A0A381F834_9FLAO|nr:ATP-binding protein [Chryseobacterium indoltheticum]AZA72985.1 two-component sensor histidine kinase [Chryseobacterium indoltheticum]MDF2831023.1 two-component sensor histidine kinase [Chryseobacterium indoltheticum]SIP90784.1 Histidine kinase-, DNA gyrase B-, and HSP90-like ATPase [Chryseobacterium indoltheticum]SUX42594.1 Sensor protein vraS [Chryseobacterium indoltheticum]
MGKTELYLTVILFNIFFVLFLVAVMIYIRKYKQRKIEHINEIQLKNEIHQKELLATQLEIQQATMQQIGRELHDNIGQKLTLASLYTQQLLYENKVTTESERIEQVSQIINQSLQDLRSLSKTLTDDNINQKDIIKLIQEEVDIASVIKKCKIHFEYNFKCLDLDFVHKNVLLRITQEFIQNSIKHSQCKNIFIRLNTTEENLWELKINDDGIGFDIDKILSNGIGLTNMKNRTAIIGAEFNLESNENAGTLIEIKLKKRP